MAEDRQACMADAAEGGHTGLWKEKRIILNFWLIIQMNLNISAFMVNWKTGFLCMWMEAFTMTQYNFTSNNGE